MLHAEDGEDEGQERRISRQANVSGRNFFGAAEAVDAVLEPVFGNVAINKRVGHNSRKAENKQQPQSNSGGGEDYKKSQVFADQGAHLGNILEFRNPQRSTCLRKSASKQIGLTLLHPAA